MKKQSLFNRLAALCLALLIGATSMGFSIDLHFCQGHLKSIAFVGTANSCHDASITQCPNHPVKSVMDVKEKTNCCSNEAIFLQNDNDQQFAQQFVDVTDIPISWIASSGIGLFYTNLHVFNDADFEHYKPPLIPQDRQILFESFLI